MNNRTAITKSIDGLEIVTGFGELSIDPMATNPVASAALVDTDELKAVKVVQDKRNASVSMAMGARKLSKTAKNEKDRQRHWDTSENHFEQAKGHENEIKGMLPALKAKRKELIVSEAVYFEPKDGEHLIDSDAVADLSEKIAAGNLVNLAGDIIDDNRGVVYCKKGGGKWSVTRINTLGVAVPVGVILYGDLDEVQLEEVDLQIEINGASGLSAADRVALKLAAVDIAAQKAVALRSQYEIQGTDDPLAESQEWYNSRLAELDLIYG